MNKENSNFLTPFNSSNPPQPPTEPEEALPIASDPPLSSPLEPTRLYPSHSSKTYSSDPSKYAYPHPSEETDFSHPLDSQEDSSVYGSDVGPKPNEAEKQNYRKTRWTDSFTAYSKKPENIFKNSYKQRINYFIYALLVAALITMFIFPLVGELLIGIVAGYFFKKEVFYCVSQVDDFFTTQNQLRFAVLSAILISLIIKAPGIFIGLGMGVVFKQIRFNSNFSDS